MSSLVKHKFDELVRNVSCVNNYTNWQSISHQPYTINIKARAGSRSLKDFEELLKTNPNARFVYLLVTNVINKVFSVSQTTK